MKQNIITLLSLLMLIIGCPGFSQDMYYFKGDSIVKIYRLQEVVVYGNREQIPSSMLISV